MSESEYIDKRAADASYRPKGYGISPGLQRARAPYRARNALTGIAIFSFAVGVWAYSISAVKQDNFEDIDEEAKLITAARKPGANEDRAHDNPSSPISERSRNSTIEKTYIHPDSTMNVDSPKRRGLWVSVLDRYLDPNQKTLIWGAPPIDGVDNLND